MSFVPYYKYIFRPYVPKYQHEFTYVWAIKASYNELELFPNESAAKREIHRRDDLFLSIANFLGMKRSSIYDESLEYIVLKSASTLEVEDIIDYIKEQESHIEETAFKKIEREESSYRTEISLRQLIGLDTYFKENDVMLEFNELNDQVIVNITFEIEKALKVYTTSTNTTVGIEGFLKKYENQKGIFWTSLREKISMQKQEKIDYEKRKKQRELIVEKVKEEIVKRQIAIRKDKRKKELAASQPKTEDFRFGTLEIW